MSSSYTGRVIRNWAPARSLALVRATSAAASCAPGLNRAPMWKEVLVASARPLLSRPWFSPFSSPASPTESTSQIPSTLG